MFLLKRDEKPSILLVKWESYNRKSKISIHSAYSIYNILTPLNLENGCYILVFCIIVNLQ